MSNSVGVGQPGRTAVLCGLPAAVLAMSVILVSSADSQPPQAAAGATSDLLPATLSRWVPDSAIGVFVARDLSNSWEHIRDSSMMQRVQALPEFQRLLQTPQYQQFLTGRQFIEGLFERDLDGLLQSALTRPALVIIDRGGQVAAVLEPDDETYVTTQRVLTEFVRLAALSRDSASRGNALRSVNYRGVSAFAFDQARVAFHEGQILICSGRELGKAALDRVIDNLPIGWTNQAWSRAALDGCRQLIEQPAVFSGIVNLNDLRSAGQLPLQRGNDLGRELILGGVLESLESADYAIVSGDLRDGQLYVQAAIPLPTTIPEPLGFFFGPDQRAAAPAPIELPDRVLSFRWQRDLGAFWNFAPQLITDENVLAGLAKSESDLGNLFGGMTSVGDVFGFLEPQLEVVVCQPAFAADETVPDIQFPDFALVGRLRDRQHSEKVLRLAFQQFVSFTNINAGAGGFPPMEILSEKVDGNLFATAEYMDLSDSGESRDSAYGGLYRNFSPTLAVSDERLVLASDRRLAERIIAASNQPDAGPAIENTVIEVWPHELAKLGRLNRDVLISQRMLETGRDKQTVTGDIDAILTIAECFGFTSLRLEIEHSWLTLRLDSQFADPATSAGSR